MVFICNLVILLPQLYHTPWQIAHEWRYHTFMDADGAFQGINDQNLKGPLDCSLYIFCIMIMRLLRVWTIITFCHEFSFYWWQYNCWFVPAHILTLLDNRNTAGFLTSFLREAWSIMFRDCAVKLSVNNISIDYWCLQRFSASTREISIRHLELKVIPAMRLLLSCESLKARFIRFITLFAHWNGCTPFHNSFFHGRP